MTSQYVVDSIEREGFYCEENVALGTSLAEYTRNNGWTLGSVPGLRWLKALTVEDDVSSQYYVFTRLLLTIVAHEKRPTVIIRNNQQLTAEHALYIAYVRIDRTFYQLNFNLVLDSHDDQITMSVGSSGIITRHAPSAVSTPTVYIDSRKPRSSLFADQIWGMYHTEVEKMARQVGQCRIQVQSIPFYSRAFDARTPSAFTDFKGP